VTQGNTDGPRYTTLRDYLTILRRQRVVVVLFVVLGAAVAITLSARQDPTYRAESSLSFREPTQDVELIGIPPVRSSSPEQRAAFGAEQAVRRDVIADARRRLGITESVDAVAARVSARPEVNTNLVVVQAEAQTGAAAARLANAVAAATRDIVTTEQKDRYSQLIRRVNRERRRVLAGQSKLTRDERRQLESSLIPLRTTRDLTKPVEIVQPAAQPDTPVSPRPVRNAIIGVLIGLLVALLVAALRTALDRRLRGTGQIAELTDAPVLAVVREAALGRVNTGSYDGADDAELDLESFRVLRTNLDYVQIDSRVESVIVTSPLSEEGKSTVAASLAVAQALAGRRTLIVDCDLRRPVLAQRFGLEAAPGLADYLVGHAEPQDVLRTVSIPAPGMNGNGPTAAPSLTVITAGERAPRPAELLASRRFAAFLAQVQEAYDVVILDTPPLLPVPDALEIVPSVDVVVLCVRAHQTTRDDLRAALRALEKLPDRPTGIVMTGLRKPDESYAYYYGRYAYGSGS